MAIVSTTHAGRLAPSTSTVTRTVARPPLSDRSTLTSSAPARIRESTGTGDGNRSFRAVVDLHGQSRHLVDLLDQHWNQGQGEVAMRNRPAVGPAGCLFRIDVDPLAIARRVGEQIDLFLRDGPPIAVSKVLTDVSFNPAMPV